MVTTRNLQSLTFTKNYFRLKILLIIFLFKHGALLNKRKLAAINSDVHENDPRNNQARNIISHRIQEDFITQLSEEIEGRVTGNLHHEFSRSKSCIWVALSKLDDFLLNPQARVHSRLVPETSRSSNRMNQGTNEDRSQNELYPQVGASLSQLSQALSPEETSYTYIRGATNIFINQLIIKIEQSPRKNLPI